MTEDQIRYLIIHHQNEWCRWADAGARLYGQELAIATARADAHRLLIEHLSLLLKDPT